jgi:hypothetical protein
MAPSCSTATDPGSIAPPDPLACGCAACSLE